MKLVICQYVESVEWAKPYDHQVVRKGVDMPNVGREAAAYLFYIICNYHRLDGDYAFLQEFPFDHAPNLLAELETKTYYGDLILDSASVEGPFYNKPEVHRICSILGLPLFPTYRFKSGAQFRVSAVEIKKRPLEWYANAYTMSVTEPSAPWVFEQVWPLIFDLGEISGELNKIPALVPRQVNGETSTCRARLSRFCVGNGADLGFGGDPIIDKAICVDWNPGHLCKSGTYSPFKTHLLGSVADLKWFQNDSLDWVYSSHCLEDFTSTESILKEWLRVIKPGGNLIIFCPDQPAYEKCCKDAGVEPNAAHVHKDFSLEYVKSCLSRIGISQNHIVHELWPVPDNPYSFDLVVRKPTA